MKFLYLLTVIVAASSCGFIIHVFSAEWLQSWIAVQMKDTIIEPSWNVRYIAFATSTEYGCSALAIYYLIRKKIKAFTLTAKIALLSVLLISIHGALLRQPVMDFVIGNPLHVVAVQNIAQWLVWILMSICVVSGYEAIHSRYKPAGN